MEELDRNNPDLWKFGVFYYNPKDPNILPHDPLSRGVSGVTFNFGHKRATVIIALFFVIILAFAGYIVFYM